MERVKHRILGDGTVISKIGNEISIKFDKDGKISTFLIPSSFKCGWLELSEELKKEIDAAAKAEEESRIKAAEKMESEKAAALAAAKAAPKSTKSKAKKTPAKVTAKHSTEQAFTDYLIKSGYTEETKSGADSTVPTYVKKINKILEEEHLTWDVLPAEIGRLISIYDVGGIKEAEGTKSNRTPINALCRFRDFLNNAGIP